MQKSYTHGDLLKAAGALQARSRCCPRVVVILGSGLSSLADEVEQATAISYTEIPSFPNSTVAGHPGRLVLGHLQDTPVAILQGRAHYYEGYDLAEVTWPIRVLRQLGAEVLIVTNAAGAVHQDWLPGDLMLITDHINLPGLAGINPLRGPNDDALGPRFPAMSNAYDAQLLHLARQEAQYQAFTLREGIYAMVGGPNFETPAEIRFLRAIGVDVVGMSTVPEVLVARHSGMRVLGISFISNITLDQNDSAALPARHEDVLEAGSAAANRLIALIKGILPRI